MEMEIKGGWRKDGTYEIIEKEKNMEEKKKSPQLTDKETLKLEDTEFCKEGQLNMDAWKTKAQTNSEFIRSIEARDPNVYALLSQFQATSDSDYIGTSHKGSSTILPEIQPVANSPADLFQVYIYIYIYIY